LQEREEEQKMIATSGMKLLESSESVNLNGSLGKMLKALLTSKKAWSSDRCKMIWKKKVSKSNVLLFQLQVSVRGIKEKESGLSAAMYPTPTSQDHSRNTVPPSIGKTRGMDLSMRVVADQMKMYPTPTTIDHIDRKGMRPSRAATNRKSGYLSEMIKMYPTPQVDDSKNVNPSPKRRMTLAKHVKMYPTPTASDIEGGVAKDVQMKNGHFFRENKKGERWGVKLRDAMSIYPTPTAHDSKNVTFPKSQTGKSTVVGHMLKNKQNKVGGKLNPHFVEFLMGYPMNWTKIEPTE
jgi:hypothetical protein